MFGSRTLLPVVAVWVFAGALRAQDPDRLLEQAQKRFLKGLYSSAIKKFQKAEKIFTEDLKEAEDEKALKAKRFEARFGELRTLEMTGKYEACARRLVTLMKEEEGEGVLRRLNLLRGRLLLTTGNAKEALDLYEEIIASDEKNVRARLGKAYALSDLGKKEEAYEAFDWFVDFWALREGAPDADVLETVAKATIGLGPREQDLYIDAQRLLERCEKDFPENQDARVALANLYIERYTQAQAVPVLRELFKANPNHPEGRATMAVLLMKRWKNKEARQECERALKVNPNLPRALVAKGSLLIADQDYEGAEKLLRKAVEVCPLHVEAMSFLAGCLYMRGDREGFEAMEKKVLGLRPDYGAFHYIVGAFVAMRRRLVESLDHFRKAIEIDPELWAAHFSLGLSLSRMGRHAEAKKVLERGYRGDKYNVQVYNLLKLFDDYGNHFVTKETPHFRLLFHKSEAAIMEKYCGRLLEESWEKLTKKYKFTPGVPVFSEMFSLHPDFAVRTMGFPGLGALGACFGPLITLDSPKARPFGAFNWASTTWHEFAHVVTVQLSKGRVPRWFTEGLSVYEERCGRPYWVRQTHRVLLGRLKAGGLTPIKELNAQFTGGDVLLAYFHSSWVVEFIIETYGFQAIIDMLKAYGRDLNDARVFSEVLSETPEVLDAKFKAWLEKRFAHIQVTAIYSEEERKKLRLEVEKSPSDPALRTRYARACLQNGKLADAEINAGWARKLDPSGGDASNLLGEIFFLKKRFEASKKYFHEALACGVSDYNTWLRLATMAEKAGEVEKAIKFFEAARDAFPVYAGPDSPYRSLRILYGRQGRDADALKALEALVALLESQIPLRLELAEFYRVQGRTGDAKRVLREIHEIWPFRIDKKVYPEDYFNTHLRLGDLLASEEAWEEALFEAEVALSEAMFGVEATPKEEEVEIRVFLARCLAAKGRVEEAKTQLEEVVEFLDPKNEKARKLLEKLAREGK